MQSETPYQRNRRLGIAAYKKATLEHTLFVTAKENGLFEKAKCHFNNYKVFHNQFEKFLDRASKSRP